MSEPHETTPRDSHEESQIYATYEAATVDLRKKLARDERYLSIQYQLISLVFNLITIAQVIIGAAITALGPSGGEHMLAITILGALNTSIAGLLALLKGRGLPERLRKNMVQIANVSELIQERATMLRYGDSDVSNDKISLLLQEAFQAYFFAKEIIEKNQTDTYADGVTPQASGGAADVNGSSTQKALPSENKGKMRHMDEEMGAAPAIE
ncbi:hypothetical protein N7540_005483 [Penicillium herquei]|nr:hypothetical protein N7540_005483 [Penicillium herquei]